MALFQLRRIDESRARYEQLWNIMNDPEEEWSDDEVASALFAECKQLLGASDAQIDPPENDEEDEK